MSSPDVPTDSILSPENLQQEALPHQIVPKPYAGFWIRVAANIIDGLLLGVVSGIANFIMGMAIVLMTLGLQQDLSQSLMDQDSPLMLMINLCSAAFNLILHWLYFSLMESSGKQATLGKMLFGLQVTDMQGHGISFGKASLRYLCSALSAFTLGLGYVIAAWTSKKQTLHDLIVGTVVVYNKKSVF